LSLESNVILALSARIHDFAPGRQEGVTTKQTKGVDARAKREHDDPEWCSVESRTIRSTGQKPIGLCL